MVIQNMFDININSLIIKRNKSNRSKTTYFCIVFQHTLAKNVCWKGQCCALVTAMFHAYSSGIIMTYTCLMYLIIVVTIIFTDIIIVKTIKLTRMRLIFRIINLHYIIRIVSTPWTTCNRSCSWFVHW